MTLERIALGRAVEERAAGWYRGQGYQVVDRNWKVCSQSVAPGTTITKGARIDFGTVKLDETCR